LSQLSIIYTIDEKFTSTNNNFDFKFKIFFNKCKRVELSLHVYMKKALFMFAKRAWFHFYDNQYENITFDKFRVDMKKFFEKSKWKRFNLTKWQFMHIDIVIVVNSNLLLIECLQKLCIDLNDVQKELNSDYHDSNQMRKILIQACRNHSILLIELHNSSSKFSDLIDSFYFNIVNYESINKKNNTYFKTLTSSIIFMIIFMITILSTNNIIANSNHSIIVTIVNFWLILDLAINFQFAFRKNVSHMINSIVNR
jgi:hypothetical protein